MPTLDPLRRTLSDLWDEALLLTLTGVIGGLLSLVIVTIPYVLAAHYHAALRISQHRVVSLRDWFGLGRRQLRFFIQWSLLAVFITIVLIANVLFYLRLPYEWAWMLAYAFIGLLLTWILPQPFVPAFYLQQTDRRLRTALRNTVVLSVTEPISIILAWTVVALLTLPLAYLAWPLLPAIIPVMALISTHVVKRYARGEAGDEGLEVRD